MHKAEMGGWLFMPGKRRCGNAAHADAAAQSFAVAVR
jgi:hypothetical protein